MENIEASTEDQSVPDRVHKPIEVPQKKERSEAQKAALAQARAKAFLVRQQNAELKRKERAIDKKAQEDVKQARKAKVEREYAEATKEEEPKEEPKLEIKEDEEEVFRSCAAVAMDLSTGPARRNWVEGSRVLCKVVGNCKVRVKVDKFCSATCCFGNFNRDKFSRRRSLSVFPG